MTWQLTAGANALVGIAYLVIAGTIVAVLSRRAPEDAPARPGRPARLRDLGVQFCLIAALLLAPSLGIETSSGEALRDAWPAVLAAWAVVGGAAALFLLSQRGSYGDVLLGPGLMDEVKERERQAFEINDNLVQGLSVAKYSLEMGQEDRGRRAVNESLRKARVMTTDLLGESVLRTITPAPASSGATGPRRSGEERMEVAESADTISVYLVDDVPELRELIRYGLEGDEDFTVVGEAGDGAAALEGIAETRPSAVLLDLSMPGMDGLEAIPEIRRGRPEIAIVILSGFSASRMERKARERGADGYVEKGTPMADLRQVVREAVERRAAKKGGPGRLNESGAPRTRTWNRRLWRPVP